MKENKKCELLAKEITIQHVHPDPCWIIRNREETASYSNKGSLFVFSSQQLADDYVSKSRLAGAMVKMFSWNDIVDLFGGGFNEAMVDPSMDHDGFCTVCPFIKDKN
jgi:hypothetical protein